MIEAHQVFPLFARPHNRALAITLLCLTTVSHTSVTVYKCNTCVCARVSHLIVYPPLLSPPSWAWTAAQKQGDDECSSLAGCPLYFHKMPTIYCFVFFTQFLPFYSPVFSYFASLNICLFLGFTCPFLGLI